MALLQLTRLSLAATKPGWLCCPEKLFFKEKNMKKNHQNILAKKKHNFI
jgi:hypothetical protein